jgi:hypothetical protein
MESKNNDHHGDTILELARILTRLLCVEFDGSIRFALMEISITAAFSTAARGDRDNAGWLMVCMTASALHGSYTAAIDEADCTLSS